MVIHCYGYPNKLLTDALDKLIHYHLITGLQCDSMFMFTLVIYICEFILNLDSTEIK